MTLLRFGLTLAAVLGGLSENATAHACAGYLCSNDQFLPRDGEVPANISAIGWLPGYAFRENESASLTLPRFECQAAGGGSREVRFVALPVDHPDHLKLSEPLLAGEHCTISRAVTDCSREDEAETPVQPGASYLNGRAEFDVVDASPIPEELGLLAITGAKRGYVDVAADESCSERIPVCVVNVAIMFKTATLAWQDALLFETFVDGERFSTWRSQNIPDELGGLYRGRERDLVYAPLGAIPDNAHGGEQIELGEHTLEIRAHLPGSDLILSTPPVTITLDCEPNAQTPLAANMISEDSEGCAVTRELGRSQRRPRHVLYSVLGVLGALLVAARRRTRRR